MSEQEKENTPKVEEDPQKEEAANSSKVEEEPKKEELQKEEPDNNLKIEEKIKGKENEEKNINFFEDNKKETSNKTKKKYISPNTTGRNLPSHPINVNRNSNLFSKKMNKSRQTIK